MNEALPAGYALSADPAMRRGDRGRLLTGGDAGRVMRLSAAGAAAAERLLAGEPLRGPVDAALARRLLGAGLAHPVPPRSAALPSLAVVVPSYGDGRALQRCLDALGSELPVTVVDDASPDPQPVADAARRYGARLIRLPVNRGPAAARNAGLAACSAELVAFVDDDAVITPAALHRLAGHLLDPAVGVAAPRIRPLADGDRGVLAAYAADGGPLDLGARPAAVRPGGRVPYVPSTVLVARRAALVAAAGFDEALRYGEDVDLVWRLVTSGQVVRFDPAVEAGHAEPTSWRRWWARRAAYGTAAGALARRHPQLVAPAVVRPGPAAAVVALLAGRPVAAAAAALAGTAPALREIRAAQVPVALVARPVAAGQLQAAAGLARAATQLGWPALVAVGWRMPGVRWRLAALTAAPALVEWGRRRPRLDPLRWTAAFVADDVAYGIGVWRGALGARTFRPLWPRWTLGPRWTLRPPRSRHQNHSSSRARGSRLRRPG